MIFARRKDRLKQVGVTSACPIQFEPIVLMVYKPSNLRHSQNTLYDFLIFDEYRCMKVLVWKETNMKIF